MLAPPPSGSGVKELRGPGVNGGETARHHVGVIALELAARPPFDGAGVLRWLGARLVPGVEELTGGVYRRTLRLARGPGGGPPPPPRGGGGGALPPPPPAPPLP